MKELNLRSIMADLAIALVFFTRIPLPPFEIENRKIGDALWAAPLVGVVVALGAGFAYTLSHALGINEGVAAAIALAVAMMLCGFLHEDGLADCADGFGGGRTIARKLEIMRDSRIGTYGASALGISMLLRWTSLASLPGGSSAVCALIAAHGASRAILPLLMRYTPPARDDGLAASAGNASDISVITALILGVVTLLFIGIWQAIIVAALIALSTWLLRRLFIRQIGGITGDTLGAAQQAIEILVLLCAGAMLS